jgi:ADP-ribose pyrophosphatase
MPKRVFLGDEAQSLGIVSSEKVYEGAIWNVQRETFDYHGGELTRDFVDHPGAVSIVAINDHGEIMMIRQYRHAIRALDWEIPAGLLDIPGEDPLVCAKRELVEEADLEADTWQHITRLNTTPGGSNESTHIFLATGLQEREHEYVRTGEEADLEKRWVPLEDAVASILSGEMTNQISVTAVLAVYASRH